MSQAFLYGNEGGGVFNRGTLRLTSSTVSGNSASQAGGGGVYGNLGATTIIGSIISENSGGGIRGDLADFDLINSSVSNNVGLGISLQDGSINLTNSTISGNSANGLFGALTYAYINNSTISGNGSGIDSAESRIEIADSTITRNKRGGLSAFVYSGVSLARTIISGNGRTEVEVDSDGSGVGAGNFNVIGFSGNARSIGFTLGATDIVHTQPLAGVLNTRLANNGGSTLTHALVNGSPAIDAVNNGTCPPPATDQRGLSRPRDGNRDGGVACDIGAVEALGPPGMASASPTPMPLTPEPVDPRPIEPDLLTPMPNNPEPTGPDAGNNDMGTPPIM